MAAVKTTLDPSGYLTRFQQAAETHGFQSETFAVVDGLELKAWVKPCEINPVRIYISAGIHGDEPAGPKALLALLESGEFDDRAGWWLVPIINPTGLAKGTREDVEGRDLNRDFKTPRSKEITGLVHWLKQQPHFAATWCLHEDWESRGFYLYELNPTHRVSLAANMLAAAEKIMPIDTDEFIDGRPTSEPGIIRTADDPLERLEWPEAIYLLAVHTSLSYTLETPSALPVEQRVNAHIAAVRAGLTMLIGNRKNPGGDEAPDHH